MAVGTGEVWVLEYLVGILEDEVQELWNDYTEAYKGNSDMLALVNEVMGSAKFRSEEFKWWVGKVVRQEQQMGGAKSGTIYVDINECRAKIQEVNDAMETLRISCLEGDVESSEASGYRILRSMKMLEGAEEIAQRLGINYAQLLQSDQAFDNLKDAITYR